MPLSKSLRRRTRVQLEELRVQRRPFSAGTKPNTNNEKWLCDLWAGAQCHATSCAALA